MSSVELLHMQLMFIFEVLKFQPIMDFLCFVFNLAFVIIHLFNRMWQKKIQRKARQFSKYWWLSVSNQKQQATIIFFKMMCFVFYKCKISNKHINQCESNCDTSEHYCMLLCRGFLSAFLDFRLLLLLARNSGASHNQLLSYILL